MAWFSYRSRFVLKNLFKGLLILAVIVVGYVILQQTTDFDAFMEHIGQWPLIVYSVFIFSEVVFGIIPPELFMIWSIKSGAFESYTLNIALLAMISYASGILGYFIGGWLKRKLPQFFDHYILKYKRTLNRFGGLLIFVSAVTPVPFSAICMLVGSTNFPFGKFLLIASTRFARFALYSFTIYQFNI